MIALHQSLASGASARIFQLELLELLETLIITPCMVLSFGLTMQTPWPTSWWLLPAGAKQCSCVFKHSQLTNGQLRILGAIIQRGSRGDLPPELRVVQRLKNHYHLKSSCFHIFVMLAKKKVDRQCRSSRFMNSKAAVGLLKQDREQHVQEARV